LEDCFSLFIVSSQFVGALPCGCPRPGASAWECPYKLPRFIEKILFIDEIALLVVNYKFRKLPEELGRKIGADYLPYTFPSGTYTLKASGYTETGATGLLGGTMEVTFVVAGVSRCELSATVRPVNTTVPVAFRCINNTGNPIELFRIDTAGQGILPRKSTSKSFREYAPCGSEGPDTGRATRGRAP
jgi:hypothetical protein